jgi:4-amino-4-deoxy-L-arabinose transferase-like glycosyltransferase
LNVLFCGLFFGLALISKFTFLMFIPAYLCIGLFLFLAAAPEERSVLLKRFILISVAICLIGLLVLNASYGFNFLPVNKLSTYLPVISDYRIPDSFVLPLPTEYIYELWHVVTESLRPGTLMYENYFMERFSQKGWFYFYIVVFLIKTPLPMLIFFTLAAFMTFRKPLKDNMIKECFLWIPPLIIFMLASLQYCQLGLRHVLPVYPFLFVSAGKLVYVFKPKKYYSLTLMIAILSLWLIVSTLRIFPNYLAYFNELAGGPRQGHKWLVDHDWGQDLPGLKKYMALNGIKKIKLCYLGSPGVSPHYYGIDYEPVPETPTTGLIAISTAYLQGFAMDIHDREKYQWLKEFKPTATIGYSIFIYDIDLSKNGGDN